MILPIDFCKGYDNCKLLPKGLLCPLEPGKSQNRTGGAAGERTARETQGPAGGREKKGEGKRRPPEEGGGEAEKNVKQAVGLCKM